MVFCGMVGEICMCGYLVMVGYWDDESCICEVFDIEGWMYIGDFGYLDVVGFCCIIGWIKDMLIWGGENIYLCEIEEFLFWYLVVVDVQVVGVFDECYGEEVCVCIIVKLG